MSTSEGAKEEDEDAEYVFYFYQERGRGEERRGERERERTSKHPVQWRERDELMIENFDLTLHEKEILFFSVIYMCYV
jgi:hypothetical protein